MGTFLPKRVESLLPNQTEAFLLNQAGAYQSSGKSLDLEYNGKYGSSGFAIAKDATSTDIVGVCTIDKFAQSECLN